MTVQAPLSQGQNILFKIKITEPTDSLLYTEYVECQYTGGQHSCSYESMPKLELNTVPHTALSALHKHLYVR